MSRRAVFAWGWTLLVTAATVLATLSGGVAGDAVEAATGFAFTAAVILTTALGSVVATKRPENPIFWYLYAVGTGLLAIASLSVLVPESAPAEPTVLEALATGLQGALGAALLFYPLLLLLFVFPDGHFLTRRWTWAAWVGAVLLPLDVLGSLFSTELQQPFETNGWTAPNPIGFIPADIASAMSTPWAAALVVLPIGAIWAVVARYRRSSGIVRTQIKWLLYPGLLLALSVLLIFTGSLPEGPWFSVVLVVPIALIPVSVTIAVVRYRLFEIDRLISRTISYAIVVALLAGTFFGVVALVSLLVSSDNSIAIAASTLAVAALFNPLRKRVHKAVDRRFNRTAYEYEAVADGFATRINSSLSVVEIAAIWSDTVTEALEPETAGVWVNPAFVDRG